MKQLTVDVAVIGGGTAGLSAYQAAKQHTDRVVMIAGGVCGTTDNPVDNPVDYTPSKLLMAAAQAAYHARHSESFGVIVDGSVRIDGKQVMAQIKSERARVVGIAQQQLEAIPATDKIYGAAQFIGENSLQIGAHTQVHAARIVIATGSASPSSKTWQDLDDRLLTSDDLFNWDDLPTSVAVLGTDAIGLELAQALHRLDVAVHVFGVSGQIGPLTDPDVMRSAQQTFADEFPLIADTQIESMTRQGDQVIIRYMDDQLQSQTIRVDYVIAATDGPPAIEQLGLERLNLALGERNVPIANPRTMQTSKPHIFIAGDASSQQPLLHDAEERGRIAGDNAGRWPNLQTREHSSPISVVLTEPQIAIIGMSFQQASERLSPCDCLIQGEVNFEQPGRHQLMLNNKGRLKVYAEQGTGLFVGAEMVGPAAEHVARLLAWAHHQKMTILQMLDMPCYHRDIEEAVRTALRDVAAKLDISSDCALSDGDLSAGPLNNGPLNNGPLSTAPLSTGDLG